MMSPVDQHEYDQQRLTRYLLGSLAQEETERLDQQSIADDAFADRLQAIENDLVDSYVRGELSGETLEKFKASYLRIPNRLDKVRLANALLLLEQRTAAGASEESPLHAENSGLEVKTSVRAIFPRWRLTRAFGLQWGFAFATAVLLLGCGFLFMQNSRLRQQQRAMLQKQAGLEQQSKDLKRQLNDQSAANMGILQELERLRDLAGAEQSLKTIAVLLLPPMRGAGPIAKVLLPRSAKRVTVRLQLETDDFQTYRASLKDPVADQIVWRSGNLSAKTAEAKRVVSLSLASNLLKQQNYVLELSGVSAEGVEELLSGYAFTVVVK